MKKIDISSFYSKRDAKAVLRNLEILWKDIMRIRDARKRSREILKLHRVIKNAVTESRANDSTNINARNTSRMLINWILTHREH